jgi:hypothetical protein
MVAQSEQAFLAMAQGNAPKGATVKILEYKDMEPFFIKGERDEPWTAAALDRSVAVFGYRRRLASLSRLHENDQRQRRHSGALYTWLMSPEQEQLLCDALVHLGPVETEQGLHAEGVRKIQEVLHCTLADARTTLRELRVRKRIEETTTPIEQLDQPHFRWVQPSA